MRCFPKACAYTYSYGSTRTHNIVRLLFTYPRICMHSDGTKPWHMHRRKCGTAFSLGGRFSSRTLSLSLCGSVVVLRLDSLPRWQYDLVDSLICDRTDVVQIHRSVGRSRFAAFKRLSSALAGNRYSDNADPVCAALNSIVGCQVDFCRISGPRRHFSGIAGLQNVAGRLRSIEDQ